MDQTCNPRLYQDVKFFPGGDVLWDAITPCVLRYALQCGLRESHRLLDVGCGTLRVGRHLILLLNPGCYTGLEPEEEMVQRSIAEPPLCPELLEYKQPRFIYNATFDVDGQFDFVLANQVFFHCGREQLTTFLAKIRPHLAGPLLLSVFVREFDHEHPKTDRWDRITYKHADFEHVTYTRPAFADLVESQGYTSAELGGTFMPFETFWRLDLR
jgi:SAM-dependent methyltransferase